MKHFSGVSEHLMRTIEGIIDCGPHWFVRGQTVLIQKVAGATEPGQHRPITCLNSGYKTMTGALSVILRRSIGPLLPEAGAGGQLTSGGAESGSPG